MYGLVKSLTSNSTGIGNCGKRESSNCEMLELAVENLTIFRPKYSRYVVSTYLPKIRSEVLFLYVKST
jgi:hypothetical protein